MLSPGCSQTKDWKKAQVKVLNAFFSGLYPDNSPGAKYPLVGAIKSDEMIALS